MKYGYRLYTVALRRGHSTNRTPFSDSGLYEGTDSALGDIVKIAQDNQNHNYFHSLRLRKFWDKSVENYDPRYAEDVKAVCITKVVWNNDSIDFEYKWGKEGAYTEAIGRDEDGIPLDGKAPANPFYATLFLPVDGESTAILMAESRGRMNTGLDLMKALTCLMEDFSEENPVEGVKLGWWNFTVRPISDENRLREQIAEGTLKQVKLEKHKINDMGERGESEMVFIQKTMKDNDRDEVRRRTLGMRKKKYSEVVADENTEENLVDFLTSYVAEEVQDLDWDSGALTFQTKDGETKTITPENMNAFFTYPMSTKDRPNHHAYKDDATQTIQKLLKTLKIELKL